MLLEQSWRYRNPASPRLKNSKRRFVGLLNFKQNKVVRGVFVVMIAWLC